MRQTLLILRVLARGPGPLRRRIAAQTLLLERELALTGAASRQLKEAAIARITAPSTLAAVCAAGFAAGLIGPQRARVGRYFRFALRQAAWPLLIGGAQKLHDHLQGENADSEPASP